MPDFIALGSKIRRVSAFTPAPFCVPVAVMRSPTLMSMTLAVAVPFVTFALLVGVIVSCSPPPSTMVSVPPVAVTSPSTRTWPAGTSASSVTAPFG